MKFITIRYINRHWPAPVQGAVVVRCKNADYCVLTQLSIMAPHLDTVHLSRNIVSQTNLLVLPNGRAIIQIPIVRRLI
jgi:hypothetical protein